MHEIAVYRAIDAAADRLKLMGVGLPPALKRRDKREPGRAEKEAAEDKLFKATRRYFAGQRRRILQRLESVTKNIEVGDLLNDPDDEAVLVELFIKAVRGGVDIFANSSLTGLDITPAQASAAEYARTYTTAWLAGLNNTTRDAVRKAVALFIETPGMTIGQVADLLPFSDRRALTVAVTEITRAYARGEIIAGKELQKQYPDVRVVKIWFTNNDDRVCPICEPLNGQEVGIEDGFGVASGEAGLEGPDAHVNCRCWIETTTRILQ